MTTTENTKRNALDRACLTLLFYFLAPIKSPAHWVWNGDAFSDSWEPEKGIKCLKKTVEGERKHSPAPGHLGAT